MCRQTKWSESVHNDKGILWPGLAVGRWAFVSVSTGGCATIGGKSGLTRLSLSLFGHRGTDSGVDLALPERAGCVRHVCARARLQQTNSGRDVRRTISGLGCQQLFYH